MPTIVLLDVSLSMTRQVTTSDSEEISIKDLATIGLNGFFDYIAAHCKLEQTSLMFFSSLWEKALPFTRDYESLKLAVMSQEALYDTTNIRNALTGLEEVVTQEWGVSCTAPMNVVIVTDGLVGIRNPEDETKWPLPFSFPTNLHVVCVLPGNDPCLHSSIPFYERLIEASGVPRTSVENHLWIPDGQFSSKSVEKLFLQLAAENYAPQKGKLMCGKLSSPVSLFPPVETHTQMADFDVLTFRPSGDIKIFGFMEIAEVGSPAVLSRHLVFPQPMTKEQFLTSQPSVFSLTEEITSGDMDADDISVGDEGRQPSLCVLLHGALKVEGMVAMCTIGMSTARINVNFLTIEIVGNCSSGGEISTNWYGMLYSWADSKKKFNLMLSTFRGRDEDSIPWMGSLKNLGNPLLNLKLPDAEKKKVTKSYSHQGVIVWVKHSWIQSDIQKIVRLAKRLPEKSSNFYKELSKFRKAAASSGFYEILGGMASIIERETAGHTSPEAIEHIKYAVSILKNPDSYEMDIPPLRI